MNGDNPVDRFMAEFASVINRVTALERQAVSLETLFDHRGRRLDLLQAEVERLAKKTYTKKPRKPRSDRGAKRKKGEKK